MRNSLRNQQVRHVYMNDSTIVHGIRDYWSFGLGPLTGILKNITFRKLERDNHNRPVTEVSFF
jgi:hypothetical protein